MDKTIEIAEKLNKEILQLSEVKEYLKLKELYHNDKELKEMRTNIARLKSENKEEEWDNLLKIYNSHPLVNNYFAAKEEVEKLLREIQLELENLEK